MPSGQRRELKDAGISTRREFAGLAVLPVLSRVSPAALERAHRQARLQVASDDGRIRYEILEPDRDAEGALVANRGLAALPEPAAGDLFFDIEGARYYSQDSREFGLQYLFGVVDTAEVDEAGRARYTQIWAFDRAGEKRAFEQLIDFITERRAAHPGLHVYHYNHYEPTSVDHLTELHGTRQEAVGALMGRFATREEEVDDLFRLGVFTDLYRVVRQGVRAGVENYSIKRLEPLAGYTRQVDLHEATRSLIALEAALEDGTAAGDLDRRRMGSWPRVRATKADHAAGGNLITAPLVVTQTVGHAPYGDIWEDFADYAISPAVLRRRPTLAEAARSAGGAEPFRTERGARRRTPRDGASGQAAAGAGRRRSGWSGRRRRPPSRCPRAGRR